MITRITDCNISFFFAFQHNPICQMSERYEKIEKVLKIGKPLSFSPKCRLSIVSCLSQGIRLKSIWKVVAWIADPSNFLINSSPMDWFLLVMDSYGQVDNFQPVFLTKSMKCTRKKDEGKLVDFKNRIWVSERLTKFAGMRDCWFIT